MFDVVIEHEFLSLCISNLSYFLRWNKETQAMPGDLMIWMFFFFPFQIFVVSQAEPRLPLQLDDAVRPDAEGEEVRGHGR